MNKKRVALVVLAMILVCGLSVAGTVAYLKANTAVVTNTFIAAGKGGPFVDDDDEGKQMFELLEYKVTQATSGAYTKTEKEVDENNYNVMPGTTIPKHPFVKLSRTGVRTITDSEGGVTTENYDPAPAKLFIEVCANELLTKDGSVYTWSIDSAWTKLEGVTGPNGGVVYVYGSDNGTVLTKVDADTKYDILTDDKITVDANATAEQIGKDKAIEMKFYAYLSQASVGDTEDPADVFTACFLN